MDINKDMREIELLLKNINDAWRSKQYSKIKWFLHKDAIIAVPNSSERVNGAEAYANSYRKFDESANTLEFDYGQPKIDVVGGNAIVSVPYAVVYESGGSRKEEKGTDFLVLSKNDSNWLVIWRTLQ